VDLYKVTPDATGCMTVYLDIYTWGEDLDLGLYSDSGLTDLICESTIENHATSSWESLFTGVVEGTEYYLKVYSPAEGNSTTYGISVTFTENALTVNGQSIAPVDAYAGSCDVPFVKLAMDVDCEATLDEVTVHLHGNPSSSTWGIPKLYLDADGDESFGSGDTLINIIPTKDGDSATFTDIGIPWTEASSLVIFIVADISTDTGVGNTIRLSLDDYEDLKCEGGLEADPGMFPITSIPVTVTE
jgi:hypothetical protein